jgi:hypothetical protein
MFAAIASGQAASSVLCAANDCQLLLVDVGVDADLIKPSPQKGAAAHVEAGRHIMHRKVRYVIYALCMRGFATSGWMLKKSLSMSLIQLRFLDDPLSAGCSALVLASLCSFFIPHLGSRLFPLCTTATTSIAREGVIMSLWK